MVASCQHFSVVAPCSLRSRQRPLAAISTHNISLGRITGGPRPRRRTVSYSSTEPASNPPEEPPQDAEEDGEDPHLHVNPIKNDDAAFGPRGMLLAGFNEEDAQKTAEWMQEMEPGFRVSNVVDDMMNDPLGEALYNSDSQEMRVEAWEQTRTLCPRICIMSGLTGEEQIAIVEAWEEFAGSPTPLFAAAVPNSLGEILKTILQAVVDENANNREDDPRLDPSNFLSTVDMAKLRVQVEETLRAKGITAPGESKPPSQKPDGAVADSSNGAAAGSTKGRGFG